jgi:hypothetical protein
VTRPLALLTLLVLALPAWCTPPKLSIPEEVKGAPGSWVVVSPDTTAKAVLYIGLDGLAAFPSSELRDPRKLVVFTPQQGGRWRFVAVGTLGDELATATFTVVSGDAPPPGPSPGPSPGPTPGPTDPLYQSYAAAYAADPAPQKAAYKALLSGVYAAAPNVLSAATAPTGDALIARLTAARQAAGVPDDGVVGLRRVTADQLNLILPRTPGAALTDANRAAAGAFLARAAAALDAVK